MAEDHLRCLYACERIPARKMALSFLRLAVLEMMMVNSKLFLLVVALAFSIVNSFSFINSLPRNDSGASVAVDVAVSPAGDLDPRNEATIAVSPLNERIIVGASKVIVGGGTGGNGNTRITYYYSSDGGQTWGNALLGLETPEKTFSRASDPALAVDLEGNFYLAALMLDNASFDRGVYVFKSSDGGRTFVDPVAAVADIGSGGGASLLDKSYITVDTSPTSPSKNTIYAIWVNGVPGSISISRRRPGEARFSAPKTISHVGDMRGPSITTGPNGEVYAAWEGIGNPRVILFNASTDGGDTFLPSNVAPSIDLNVHNFVGSLSPPAPVVSINGVPRMNSFPIIDVDRSAGPNRGSIYIVWAESVNGIDADVFIKKLSPPNGSFPDIGPRVKVNNDGPGADQFFPWLSVDAITGDVEVAFYDRRDDPTLINAYVARSTDAGASFADNTRVSAIGSDPRIQADVGGSTGSRIGIGDYIGLAAARGKAHLLWADTRRGKQEIFYGQVPYSTNPGNTTPSNDSCQAAREITFRPLVDNLNTAEATSSPDDPVSCTGSRDSHSVWYKFTATADTVYGIETFTSDYDTVVSVYTGTCGNLSPVSCNDDFAPFSALRTRSLLTIAVRAGTTYYIEASGKGGGGSLRLRMGDPTIANVEYITLSNGNGALKITGAGFPDGNSKVTIEKLDDPQNEIIMSSLTYTGERQGDNTYTMLTATRKKLKKVIKRGTTVLVTVGPADGFFGNKSVPYRFTR